MHNLVTFVVVPFSLRANGTGGLSSDLVIRYLHHDIRTSFYVHCLVIPILCMNIHCLVPYTNLPSFTEISETY